MKTKYFRFAIAILTVAILGGLAQSTLFAREPSYQGKRLSAWMNDFNNEEKPEVRQKARDAVRQIGTNGLPLIIEYLSSQDSPAKLRLMDWSKRQSILKFHLTPARKKIGLAFNACDALGPAAQPAIPALSRFLNGPNPDAEALFLIARIGGSNAVLSSVQTLTNSSRFLRLSTAICLELIRTNPFFFDPDEKALPLRSEGWYCHRLVRYNSLILGSAYKEAVANGTIQDFVAPPNANTNSYPPPPTNTLEPPPQLPLPPPPESTETLGPGLAPLKITEPKVIVEDVAP